MSAALQLAAQTAEIVTIDAIKQALIVHNQMAVAANEVPSLGADHRNLVKSWMQHCERLMGVKVQVELLPAQSKGLAEICNEQVVIYANHILSAQQAVWSYHYGVVGLYQVAKRLSGKQGLIVSMYRDIPTAALDVLQHKMAQNEQDKETILVEYLAQLAQLQLNPNWVQRRESWQRAVVRMMYPKLKWTSEDFHYFIYQSREALIRKRNFH